MNDGMIEKLQLTIIEIKKDILLKQNQLDELIDKYQELEDIEVI